MKFAVGAIVCLSLSFGSAAAKKQEDGNNNLRAGKKNEERKLQQLSFGIPLPTNPDVYCQTTSCDYSGDGPSMIESGIPGVLRPEDCANADTKYCCGIEGTRSVELCKDGTLPPPPPPPTPLPPVVVTGDPHFTMFGHKKYDFHGACDLVFMDNPDFNNGQGMKIHIRTKIVKWWSYVESAVVQIGTETLEVMGGAGEEKRYWVNGEAGPKLRDSGLLPFTIGGNDVRFRVLSDTQWQLKVMLPNNQHIVLRAVKDFMKVDIQHSTQESFGTSKGLLGKFGADEAVMLARDGMTVLEDPNEFGWEWQVRDTEPMLFHDVGTGPHYPERCTMPDASQVQRRRLGEGSLLGREAAAEACHNVDPWDFEDCITDVMSTGDVAMAGAF